MENSGLHHRRQSVIATTRRLLTLDREAGARAAARTAALAAARLRSGEEHAEVLADHELCAAVAELLEVAAWILFDAEEQTLAHRLNQRALALSRRCEDRSTERLVLANLSMQEAHTGRLHTSFRTAATGLETSPTARVATVFAVRQARALAMAGQRAAALNAFDRAGSLFQEGLSEQDPPWAWWVDQSELDGHRGFTLAALQEWDKAIPLLRGATQVQAPGSPPYRVLFTTELFSALVNAGAWSEARDVAEQLMPHAGGIGSGRAVSALRHTIRTIQSRSGTPARLRDAAHQLAALLPPSALLPLSNPPE
ncbi:DNA-binding protein [Streptantibioticus ferralitis]|uniref:DNA-binding protein n=1 Tax=Streptantibioticus ferralitis TaxID=236510 RepID=A0ABT5YZ92_9ACTN|nr:DNA-binding protein [Streptantibioticus ferralitis]MDF2256110.1 DNA-binding protein [Streptantibioticus ferralitis]